MAEVEVKRASIKEIRPLAVATGTDRMIVPTMMASRKLIANRRGGWTNAFFSPFNLTSYKSIIKPLLGLSVKSRAD